MSSEGEVAPMEIEESDPVLAKALHLLKQPMSENYLSDDHRSQLPKRVDVDFVQNDMSRLRQLWGKIGPSGQKRLRETYGDITLLLDVKVEEELLKAALYFWDPAYRCFTFGRYVTESIEGKYDMVPTVEEYQNMLMLKHKPDRVYRPGPHFPNGLAKMLEMEMTDFRPHMEGDYVPASLLMDYVDKNYTMGKSLDVLALLIYGLVIFPKRL